MDFISIAQSTSAEAIQRYLQEDDDFSHLDTTHTSHHEGASQQHTSDSILDMTKEAAAFAPADDSPDNPPMLSASAEAELFLLATNFLLCKCVMAYSTVRIYLSGQLLSYYVLYTIVYCIDV
jgi:hypothetical protein